jgi:glutamate 5-kinase
MGKNKKCIVIKIGTNIITAGGDTLDKKLMVSLAFQASMLYTSGWRVVIVSSGAVALGLPRIRKKNRNILCKQRAAARGQPLLMAGWREVFARYDIEVDQLLFTKKNFLTQIEVLRAINDGVAILNGDDTAYDLVTEETILYEDNDDLAADAAIALPADVAILLTDVPGILNTEGNHLAIVDPFEDLTKSGVFYNGKSKNGIGGAESKHRNASRIAVHGIWTAITRGGDDNVLLRAARRECIGTVYSVR